MTSTSDEGKSVPISVIIPCYNVRDYVFRCIDSVLNQEIPAQEIIIVDDGSTDGTFELLNKTYSSNTKIKILKTPVKATGVSPAAPRNMGRKYATGKFLHFIDADDWLLPDAYVAFYESLMQHQDLELFCYSYERYKITDDGLLLEEPMDRRVEGVFPSAAIAFRCLRRQRGHVVVVWAYIIRNNPDINDFVETIHEDNEFTARVFMQCGRTIVTRKPLYAHVLGRPGSVMTERDYMISAGGYLTGWNALRKFAKTHTLNRDTRYVLNTSLSSLAFLAIANSNGKLREAF